MHYFRKIALDHKMCKYCTACGKYANPTKINQELCTKYKEIEKKLNNNEEELMREERNPRRGREKMNILPTPLQLKKIVSTPKPERKKMAQLPLITLDIKILMNYIFKLKLEIPLLQRKKKVNYDNYKDKLIQRRKFESINRIPNGCTNTSALREVRKHGYKILEVISKLKFRTKKSLNMFLLPFYDVMSSTQ